MADDNRRNVGIPAAGNENTTVIKPVEFGVAEHNSITTGTTVIPNSTKVRPGFVYP
jgi:hypothetical protein